MLKVHIKADGKYPIDRKRIRSLVSSVMEEKRISGDIQLSIFVVGDRKMTYFNETYKKHKGTTDVLSFPYSDMDSETYKPGFEYPPDEGMILGDIVISYPEARKRAMKRGKMVDDVIDFLVDHGLKHLMGEHHD
ncbi:rRNA maturation RNase YbeY [Patescibacteria group bacterium]